MLLHCLSSLRLPRDFRGRAQKFNGLIELCPATVLWLMDPVMQKHLAVSQGEMPQVGKQMMLFPKESGGTMEITVVRICP